MEKVEQFIVLGELGKVRQDLSSLHGMKQYVKDNESIVSIMNMDEDELSKLRCVGEKTARLVVEKCDQFKDTKSYEILKQNGLVHDCGFIALYCDKNRCPKCGGRLWPEGFESYEHKLQSPDVKSEEHTVGMMKLSEVCELLNMSDQTVVAMLKEGLFKAYKIKGRYRIDRDSFMRFLESCRIK